MLVPVHSPYTPACLHCGPRKTLVYEATCTQNQSVFLLKTWHIVVTVMSDDIALALVREYLHSRAL
jgi:hypothetical protein